MRHRHLVDEAHVHQVAAAQALVVEQRQLRDAERPAGEHEVAGVAADGHVVAAARGRADELGGAVHEPHGAGGEAAAAVAAGEHRPEAVAPGQQVGAGEAPRRDRDDVPGILQAPHDGREEDDVRGVGDVDPDPQLVPASPRRCGRLPAAGRMARRGVAQSGDTPPRSAGSGRLVPASSLSRRQLSPAATAAATSRTWSSVRLGCIGTARFCAAASSVAGKSPSLWPWSAKAGCSCSGVV